MAWRRLNPECRSTVTKAILERDFNVLCDWIRDNNKVVWKRQNKPRFTLASANIRRENNYLYEQGLHKNRTARINGSRISFILTSPVITELVFLVPCFDVHFEWAKRRNDSLCQRNCAIFSLSVSFQIIIPVKIGITLQNNQSIKESRESPQKDGKR